MEIVSIIGLGLIAAVLAVVLRQYRPEYALLVSVAAGIFILYRVIAEMLPVLDEVRGILEHSAVPAEFIGILLKALAICFLTQIACDICKDAGESATASKIEMAGKVAVLGVSLPLFRQVLAVVYSLLG